MCRDRRSVLAEHQPFKLTDTKELPGPKSELFLLPDSHRWRSAPKVPTRVE
jgi:hypothetical protein